MTPPDVAGWSAEVVWENSAGGVTRRLTSPTGRVRYYKAQPLSVWPPLSDEAARMRWASDHLPVPDVVDCGEAEGRGWLLTEAIHGVPSHTLKSTVTGPEMARILAEGLRAFHAVPVDDCPFEFGVDAALAHVERRAAAGLIVPEVHLSPAHAHLSIAEAVEHLHRTKPTREHRVVCHGDYCAPNALIEGGAVVGFVDLGELGVADRWWDLAAAIQSLSWNFGAGLEPVFYDAYGVTPDEQKLRWYSLLYDLVS